MTLSAVVISDSMRHHDDCMAFTALHRVYHLCTWQSPITCIIWLIQRLSVGSSIVQGRDNVSVRLCAGKMLLGSSYTVYVFARTLRPGVGSLVFAMFVCCEYILGLSVLYSVHPLCTCGALVMS